MIPRSSTTSWPSWLHQGGDPLTSTPSSRGLTNLSCHFATNDGEYVYRHPGIGTELLINRAGEVAAQKVAKQLGIDETFIHEDPERGWKISRFIPNCKNLDPHDPVQVARAMQMARSLHESGVTVETTFDFYQGGQALRVPPSGEGSHRHPRLR